MQSALHAQPLPAAQPEEVGLSSKRLERLTAVIQAYVDDDKLPGAVALVARRGKVAYFMAFAERDRESGADLSVDSIYRIASQTKALVSVGVMLLQEEGELLIADPVGDYLPEFAETTVAVANEDGEGYAVIAAERPITIRDLLTHTAGISYGGGAAKDRWEAAGITGWYFADRDEPVGATYIVQSARSFPASCSCPRVSAQASRFLRSLTFPSARTARPGLVPHADSANQISAPDLTYLPVHIANLLH